MVSIINYILLYLYILKIIFNLIDHGDRPEFVIFIGYDLGKWDN